MDITDTSTDSQQTASTMLFCRMCQAVYKQPKLLPCLHTFCTSCLMAASQKRNNSTLVCPLCCHELVLSPGGVADIPDNCFVERLCQEYLEEVQAHLVSRSLYPNSTVGSPSVTSPQRTLAIEFSPSKQISASDRRQQQTITYGESHRTGSETTENVKGGEDMSHLTSVDAVEVIRNINKLQKKIMSLQGEALRVTYAIDLVNEYATDWHQHKDDFRKAIKRRSEQFQFFIQRMEHQMTSQIDSKSIDDIFHAESTQSKSDLRKNLNNILHEVSVLKNIQEYGSDAEINALSSSLLERSVGLSDVVLKKMQFGLQTPTKTIEEVVAAYFGDVRLDYEDGSVYSPEVHDFNEDQVVKSGESEVERENFKFEYKPLPVRQISIEEDKELENATIASAKRRSVDRRSRRYKTDLGLKNEDVKEYLAQFQTARETFRTRRLEILEQGQRAREDASPLREEIHRRPRSLSRGGRGQSLDRAVLPVLVSEKFAPKTSAEAPEIRYTRAVKHGHTSASSKEDSSYTQSSNSLTVRQDDSSSSLEPSLIPQNSGIPSPIPEDAQSPVRKFERQASDPYHSDRSPAEDSSETSPQSHSQFLFEHLNNRRLSNPGAWTGRRHSDQFVFLRQGQHTALDLLNPDRSTGRPLRRAITNVADKKAKIEFLRENWQKRKEILIQNEGFVSSDALKKSSNLAEKAKINSTEGLSINTSINSSDETTTIPSRSSEHFHNPIHESMNQIKSRIAQYRQELSQRNEQENKNENTDPKSYPSFQESGKSRDTILSQKSTSSRSLYTDTGFTRKFSETTDHVEPTNSELDYLDTGTERRLPETTDDVEVYGDSTNEISETIFTNTTTTTGGAGKAILTSADEGARGLGRSAPQKEVADLVVESSTAQSLYRAALNEAIRETRDRGSVSGLTDSERRYRPNDGEAVSGYTVVDTASRYTADGTTSRYTTAGTASKYSAGEIASRYTADDTTSRLTADDTISRLTADGTTSRYTAGDTTPRHTAAERGSRYTTAKRDPINTAVETGSRYTAAERGSRYTTAERDPINTADETTTTATSKQTAETSDRRSETSDRRSETSGRRSETSDRRYETSDRRSETSDRRSETSERHFYAGSLSDNQIAKKTIGSQPGLNERLTKTTDDESAKRSRDFSAISEPLTSKGDFTPQKDSLNYGSQSPTTSSSYRTTAFSSTPATETPTTSSSYRTTAFSSTPTTETPTTTSACKTTAFSSKPTTVALSTVSSYRTTAFSSTSTSQTPTTTSPPQTTTNTTTTPAPTSSSRYSRYQTRRTETIDVASLIAAMYSGNEKSLIHTTTTTTTSTTMTTTTAPTTLPTITTTVSTSSPTIKSRPTSESRYNNKIEQLEDRFSRKFPAREQPKDRHFSQTVSVEQPEYRHFRSNVATEQPEDTFSRNIVATNQEENRLYSTVPIKEPGERLYRRIVLSKEPENKLYRSTVLSKEPEEILYRSTVLSKEPEERLYRSTVLSKEPENRHSNQSESTEEPEDRLSRSTAPTEEPEDRLSRSNAPTEEPEDRLSRSTAPTEEPEDKLYRSTAPTEDRLSRSTAPTEEPEDRPSTQTVTTNPAPSTKTRQPRHSMRNRFTDGVNRRHTIEIGREAIENARLMMARDETTKPPQEHQQLQPITESQAPLHELQSPSYSQTFPHSYSSSPRSTTITSIIDNTTPITITQQDTEEESPSPFYEYKTKTHKTTPSPLQVIEEKPSIDQSFPSPPTTLTSPRSPLSPLSPPAAALRSPRSPTSPSSPTQNVIDQKVKLREIARKKKERWRHLTLN